MKGVKNVIIMTVDFAALMLYMTYVSPDAMGDKPVIARVAVCAVASAGVFLLTVIPYIGRVFQLGASAALCRAVTDIADCLRDGAFMRLREENFVLWLIAVIAIFALCLLLHLRRTTSGATFDGGDEADESDGEEADDGEEPDGYEEYEYDVSGTVNGNIYAMAEASDCYNDAAYRTRRCFDAIKSGEYLISEEQLTVISGIAEEFEQLVGKASDIFIGFDGDGGHTDCSGRLMSVAERMESLASVMENVAEKLPLAGEQLYEDGETEQNGNSAYFNGCRTLTDLKKRYKSLSKIFHPDTEMGDTESMQRINDEFERLKKELKK